MEAEIEYPVSRLDTEKDSALLGNRLHIDAFKHHIG